MNLKKILPQHYPQPPPVGHRFYQAGKGEAYRIGLVNKEVPLDELETAVEMAKDILKNYTDCKVFDEASTPLYSYHFLG